MKPNYLLRSCIPNNSTHILFYNFKFINEIGIYGYISYPNDFEHNCDDPDIVAIFKIKMKDIN